MKQIYMVIVVVAAIVVLLLPNILLEEKYVAEYQKNVKYLEERGYKILNNHLGTFMATAAGSTTVSTFGKFIEILNQSVTMEFYREFGIYIKRVGKTIYARPPKSPNIQTYRLEFLTQEGYIVRFYG